MLNLGPSLYDHKSLLDSVFYDRGAQIASSALLGTALRSSNSLFVVSTFERKKLLKKKHKNLKVVALGQRYDILNASGPVILDVDCIGMMVSELTTRAEESSTRADNLQIALAKNFDHIIVVEKSNVELVEKLSRKQKEIEMLSATMAKQKRTISRLQNGTKRSTKRGNSGRNKKSSRKASRA